MIFVAIQLFLLGSQIQKGNEKLVPRSIPEHILEEDRVMFFRLFGNKILTLCFVTLGLGLVSLFLTKPTTLPAIFILIMVVYTILREVLLYRGYKKRWEQRKGGA